MKSVLMSIQPYYLFLIIAKTMGWNIEREKIIEVRKTYPKDKSWNRIVKMYCSKNKKSFSMIPKEYQPLMEPFLGKVVGDFICDEITKHTLTISELFDSVDINCDDACLKVSDIKAYLGMKYAERKGNYTFFGWYIFDLVIYDKPKELSEFCKPTLPTFLRYEDDVIKRPPQSWCYVEELSQ